MLLDDNYDSTVLETEFKLDYKVLRITTRNKYSNTQISIDLDKEKLLKLWDELDNIINKM